MKKKKRTLKKEAVLHHLLPFSLTSGLSISSFFYNEERR